MAYIDNLVEGVLLAATVPAAAGRLYHITDGEDVTCREVLDAIAGALGCRHRDGPYRSPWSMRLRRCWRR